MAPKETKKDRERRLKKAEELTTATDAPTDGPTDNDKPDEELLYEAEGGLMKPGTSAAAGITAGTTVASTLVSSDTSDADCITTQGEKGSARARTGRSTPTRAKRAASTRSSRYRTKQKKSKARRRHKRESSSSSTDNDRRRGRGRSPSSLSGSSSSNSSGDSNWEEFYDNATVVKVRELLKTAPPPPRELHATCQRGAFPLKRRERSSSSVWPIRGRRISG
jgi:hypothetical protein